MRPVRLGPYSPITALTTAFNAQTFNSTGAATAPTTTATSDGLAHQVTLVAPVQATLAGITFTIVGTDADGNPKTETGLTGPASGATVTSTGYFKTVLTIQPSATMGALVVSVGVAAPSLTPTIPLDWRSIVAATHQVDVSGTINYTMQETMDLLYSAASDTLSWGSLTSAFSAKTADVTGVGLLGATGARVLINTVTNGATLTWRLVQPVSAE
jgi:hypothetical protein